MLASCADAQRFPFMPVDDDMIVYFVIFIGPFTNWL